jgi:membrane protease subunit HflK
MGLIIVDVNFQSARPPNEVKDAFDDAIAAREDQERFIRESEAYRNDVLPKAEGEAERINREAQGYAETIVNKAQGKASQFNQLLPEYQAAKEVTRQRLYLEAMESVYAKTSKVLVSEQGGNDNVFYLPLDQMLKNNQESAKMLDKAPVAEFNNSIQKQLPLSGNGDSRSSGQTVERQGRFQ